MAPEEELFESCKQYMDTPEALGLDGIDWKNILSRLILLSVLRE